MGHDLLVTNAPIFRTTQPRAVQPGEYNPLMKGNKEPHATVKTHHYYTGCGSHQTIVEAELPSVDIFGTQASVALGKDVVQQRDPYHDPAVVDVYLKRPVTDNLAIKGRLRSRFHPDKSSCQARLGVEASMPVCKDGKVYVQVYGADTFSTKGSSCGLKPGVFAGYDHQFTDRLGAYVEVQAYDLGHVDRDTLGVNAGLRYSF